VPYGAWMGSVIEDAFYPPHDLAVEIQTFLGDHEDLFAPGPTLAEVGVVFSIESNYRALAAREVMADNRTNARPEGEVPFGVVCEVLSSATQPYDVIFFPEGELRPDDLTPEHLLRYRTIVLPDCTFLTEPQAQLLEAFADGPGNLVVLGELGANLEPGRRKALFERDGVVTGDAFGFSLELLPGGPQVAVAGERTDAAMTVQELPSGAALHLIRYDYDEATDRVPQLGSLEIDVRLPFTPSSVRAVSPGGEMGAAPNGDGRPGAVRLENVPLYSIVVFDR
jgi:hypothetical protein